MPDLGKYAGEVLSAYAVSLTLLVLITLVTLWSSRRARSELARLDARQRRSDDA